FIERLDMPVAVVGVGATLPLGESVDSIDPEHAEITSRFTRAVLDRSATIRVRGRTTADLLAHLGYGEDAVRLIGCPSMFRTGPLPSPTRRPAPSSIAQPPWAAAAAPLLLCWQTWVS